MSRSRVTTNTLARLQEEICFGDESVLVALDRLAAKDLGKDRPDQRLWPHLDEVVRLRTDGHPWARLLIAATLVGIDSRGAPVPIPAHAPDIETLLASARRTFRRRHDVDGEGITAMVRGNWLFGHGRLAEAVSWWGRARALLGERMPAQELTLAHLSLDAYQRGDLAAARAGAVEAAATARLRANNEAEAVAQIYIAMYAFNSGAFSVAEIALAEAGNAFERVPAGAQRVERPLVDAGRGVLLALRKDHDEAEAAFTQALRIAQSNGIPWFEAVTRALRAEFTAHTHPPRALEDGKRSTEFFASTGDEWWWNWSVRAQAIAARHTMNLHTSQDLLRRALAREQNAIERGRTLLELGRTMLAAGEDENAVDTLSEALRSLEDTGADYFLAQVLVALSEADPAPGARWRERAFSLAREPDPAWLALLESGGLRVWLLGEPMALVGDERVSFASSRAELVVYALALAGDAGLRPDQIIELLWPADQSERLKHRLRSTIWEARQALGPEGWRVRRKGKNWALEQMGVWVDLNAARAQAQTALMTGNGALAEEALGTLRLPLLPAWTYEDWVQEQARDIERLVRQVEGLAH